MSDQFIFAKLVVGDLDHSARFYSGVFGVVEANRVKADVDGRPIEEILFAPTSAGGASLVLVRFEDRTAPALEESILGFSTDDLEALIARVEDHGGSVVDEIREIPEHGVRVAFVADNEGHLIEVIEMLASD